MTLDQLEALYGKATKGPIKWNPADVETCGVCDACTEDRDPEDNCKDITFIGGAEVSKIFTVDCGDYQGLNDQDAEFIASIYNSFPALAEELRGLRRVKEAAEVLLKNIDDPNMPVDEGVRNAEALYQAIHGKPSHKHHFKEPEN